MNQEYRTGSRLGPYTVIEPLGAIGLGARFRVTGPDGRERCAAVLEVTRPELVPALLALNVVGFEHPNVVTLREVILVERRPVLITDPLPGVMLKTRLANGPVDDELALAWIRGVLAGLSALEQRRLPHRDLRPETLLVSGEHVWMLDLGVATAVFSLMSTGRSVTTSGTTIGRPHYWAPERARRPHLADIRSDLFSLGCVAYELFAGAGPFAGLNLYDCYHATLESRFPPLPERRRGLPPHLASFVHALLRARPEDRPSSPVIALEGLQGGRRLTPPPSAGSSVAPTAMRVVPRSPPRWPIVAAVALLVAMLAGLLLAVLT